MRCVHHGIIQRVRLLNIYIRFYRFADRADGDWHNGEDHALQLVAMILVSYDKTMLRAFVVARATRNY